MDNFQIYDYEVDEAAQGLRIDRFLPTQSTDWSRTQIQQWLQEGLITVNKQRVKANYLLTLDDQIQIRIPPAKELEIKAEALPLTIVYEDSDLIVVNKERGMTVHPAPGNYTGTLVNALLYYSDELSSVNGQLRPGIVHRLDRDTSGLMMVAKNDFTHHKLAEQLKKQSVERIYSAIVHGVILHDRASIDAPIGRDPTDRKRMTVTSQNSKEAITHFVVAERFREYTLVDCMLETGRTHQIRAHLKYIGHPVVGDPKYSTKKMPEIKGQALHSKTLGFVQPRTDVNLQFTTELPEDMLNLLDLIRSKDSQE